MIVIGYIGIITAMLTLYQLSLIKVASLAPSECALDGLVPGVREDVEVVRADQTCVETIRCIDLRVIDVLLATGTPIPELLHMIAEAGRCDALKYCYERLTPIEASQFIDRESGLVVHSVVSLTPVGSTHLEWSGIESDHILVLEMLRGWGAGVYTHNANKAAENGRNDVLKLFRSWGANADICGANFAASKGHIDTLTLLHGWGIDVDAEGVYLAAQGGHDNVLTLLRSWNVDIDVHVANEAAGGGHIHTVTLLAEWGIRPTESGAQWAAGGGHIDMMKLLREWQTHMGPTVADAAANYIENRERRTEMLTLLHGWGVDCSSRGPTHAASRGYNSTLILLRSWGIWPWTPAANDAATNGRIITLRLLRSWSIDADEDGANGAAMNGHISVLKVLHEWGINPTQRGADLALRNAHMSTFELLREWGIFADAELERHYGVHIVPTPFYRRMQVQLQHCVML